MAEELSSLFWGAGSFMFLFCSLSIKLKKRKKKHLRWVLIQEDDSSRKRTEPSRP